MNDFSLTDAALADKVLDGVPSDKTDDELARRNFPSEFDSLLQQYRALQEKVEQQGTKPNTTVAQDIQGLIALNNQLSSQVKNGIKAASMAQQGQMPPQGGQPPQGQMPPQGGQPPQGQMPPQGGPPEMGAGMPTLDAGVMQNPQFAEGGIIAFANTGAVSKLDRLYHIPTQTEAEEGGASFGWGEDPQYSLKSYTPPDVAALQNVPSIKKQREKELADRAAAETAKKEAAKQAELKQTAEQYGISIPTEQAPSEEAAPEIDTQQDISPQIKDTSVPNPFYTDSDMAALKAAGKDIQKQFADAIDQVNKMEIYTAGTDPSVKMKREELIARKLANDNDVSKDRWDSLIAAGLAMMQEASKPRLQGEANALTFWGAGMKAGYDKLNAINSKYKADQDALDDALIELSHNEYLAQETNKKEAIAAKNQKIKDVMSLQNQAIQSAFDFQKALVDFGLRKDTISATRENTQAQLEATKDYRNQSLNLERDKAISTKVEARLDNLVGQTIKDPKTGKSRVITIDDIPALRPQIYAEIASSYSSAQPSSTGTGKTISLSQLPK
jgi:hypothetical protein